MKIQAKKALCFLSIFAIMLLSFSNVLAATDDNLVYISKKSAVWADKNNAKGKIALEVEGNPYMEPIDLIAVLDKSGSMDMDFLGDLTTMGNPNSACPCLNEEHFYLNEKLVSDDAVEVLFAKGAAGTPPSLNETDGTITVYTADGNPPPSPTTDTLFYDASSQSLVVFNPGFNCTKTGNAGTIPIYSTVLEPVNDKWVVLDASNPIHLWEAFSLDSSPYHFKKDSKGNFKRISEFKIAQSGVDTDTSWIYVWLGTLPWWDHADTDEGCTDRFIEAKKSLSSLFSTVVAANEINTVALVPFSTRDYGALYNWGGYDVDTTRTFVSWTRDTNALDSKLQSLVTTGNTDYMYGLSVAYNLLYERPQADKDKKKALVVFVSDGIPYPGTTTDYARPLNDAHTGNWAYNDKPSAFYQSANYGTAPTGYPNIEQLSEAIKTPEGQKYSDYTGFWTAISGLYQRHDITPKYIENGVMGMGAELVTVSLMNGNANAIALLERMATDSDNFYDVPSSKGSIAALNEAFGKALAAGAGGTDTVLTDKISKYFTIDPNWEIPDDVSISAAADGQEIVSWFIGTIGRYKGERVSLEIPIILKEEYRKIEGIHKYPTNDDSPEYGAKISYISGDDGKEKNGSIITPYLSWEYATDSGGSSEESTDPIIPNTGDSLPIMLLFAVICLLAPVLVVLGVRRKRLNNV
ncbi:MAG: VWA domain-containing protein [Oscillospiraceae bacterium]|jgi:hypothetical protein|nr:VWA domain-containing protein [Oscillospiraceae bacterium]